MVLRLEGKRWGQVEAWEGRNEACAYGTHIHTKLHRHLWTPAYTPHLLHTLLPTDTQMTARTGRADRKSVV